MKFFENVPKLPPDPIFGLTAQFQDDPRLEKVTLITGYYRGKDLKTPVLNCVRAVEEELVGIPREYLPIGGDAALVEEVGKLAFGSHWGREGVVGVQSVGGTGALFLAGSLGRLWTDVIAISDPTWVNHWAIFEKIGMKSVPYPYYRDGKLVFGEMVEVLKGLPKGAMVLLHASCHNPSGLDLTEEQWKEVLEVVEKGGLFPLIDLAYQGFGDGVEEDAAALRLFMDRGVPLAVTYTCAKNFSIYSERVGCLFFATGSKGEGEAVRSQLLKVARCHYSNPPIHGAAIVKKVLQDRREEWLGELAAMRERMRAVRRRVHEALAEKRPDSDWSALEKGKGLFYFSGKSKEAVAYLKEKGFYLSGGGRINLTGLNESVLDRFVDAFLESP